MDSSDDELLLVEPGSQKRKMACRLDVWDHFERGEEKYKKTNHRVATCKFCVKAKAKVVEVRGERSYLVKHVLGCVHVPQAIKKQHRAPNPEQPTSAKRAAESSVLSVKRPTAQGSLMGFVDRPLTTSETAQFEKLLANAFLDCNMSFRSVENESFVDLIHFLRPSVKLPSRCTFSQRIVKDRISEAVSEIDAVFSSHPVVTLTFDSFKNVSKNKLLGFVAVIRTESGTENHIFGKVENITGVSYTGDYVVEQVESALATMKTKYNGTIHAVTCDSDGAHRKARTDLKKLHPEIVTLACSAHQINLIFQDVFKFLPKFAAISKCAVSIISWFGVSTLSMGRLFKLQEVLYGKTISLPRPTHTRWYSYYFSFLNVQKSSNALQSYAVKYGDNKDHLPADTKAAIESSKFWESLKDVLALLRPLVDAQAKAESDDCTLADIGVCLADIYGSFIEHSVASERSILMEKLERRWKWFYESDLMVVAMFLHPHVKLTKFRADPSKLHNGVIGTWCTDLYKRFFKKDPKSLLPSLLQYANSTNMFEERYTSQFKKPLDFWSYVRSEHTELSDLATLLLKVSPHASGVERLWSRMNGVHTDARNLLKIDLVTGICAVKMQLHEERKKKAIQVKEKAEPRNDVMEVIQTGGPVIEPSSVVVEFDEFITEMLDEDTETDADDADDETPAMVSTDFRTLKHLFGYTLAV